MGDGGDDDDEARALIADCRGKDDGNVWKCFRFVIGGFLTAATNDDRSEDDNGDAEIDRVV
mgnify:CR=1 FL=1